MKKAVGVVLFLLSGNSQYFSGGCTMKIIEKLKEEKKLKEAKKICKQNKQDCRNCEHVINTLDYVGCKLGLK